MKIFYCHLQDANNQNVVYILFTMLTVILISLSSTCMKNKYSFQMKCSVKFLIKSPLSAIKLFTFKNKTVDIFYVYDLQRFKFKTLNNGGRMAIQLNRENNMQ